MIDEFVSKLEVQFLNKKLAFLNFDPDRANHRAQRELLDPYCPIAHQLKKVFDTEYPFSYQFVFLTELSVKAIKNRPFRINVQIDPQGTISRIYRG